MSNQPQSLIKYGEKVQYPTGKNERDMRKNAGSEFDENDPISLRSYLDTILPPKESTEEGQIYMDSCPLFLQSIDMGFPMGYNGYNSFPRRRFS